MDKYGIHVDPDALVSTLPVAKTADGRDFKDPGKRSGTDHLR